MTILVLAAILELGLIFVGLLIIFEYIPPCTNHFIVGSIIIILGILLFLDTLYKIFLKRCNNCQKRGSIRTVRVKNPNKLDYYRLHLEVGAFCPHCVKTESWRENPLFEEFAKCLET